MRPHRRQEPADHVLIAGELADLDAIEAVLLLLPPYAYGQVLVETDVDAELPPLPAPVRVGITRLLREPHPGGGHPAPGALLARAVAGWAAEWLPEEPQPDRDFSIWLGAAASESLHRLGHRLELSAARL